MISFEGIIVIIMLFFFFITNMCLTQKIYSLNYFPYLFFVSILIPATLFFISKGDDKILNVNFGLIIFYYSLILWSIKKNYSRINKIFIQKKLLNEKFAGKDFTYVMSDGEILTEDWWDEKLAQEPSWLDKSITFLLLILPIIMTGSVTFIIKN